MNVRNCVNYMLFNLLFLWFSQVRFLNSLFSWLDDKNCSHRLIIKNVCTSIRDPKSFVPIAFHSH